jgi:hypothetical protein
VLDDPVGDAEPAGGVLDAGPAVGGAVGASSPQANAKTVRRMTSGAETIARTSHLVASRLERCAEKAT